MPNLLPATKAMKGFIFFLLFVGGLVYLFRWLRQREMNAFRDADMAAFQTYALKQRKTDSTDTDKVMARAEAYAALNPDVVKLERPAADDMEDLLTAQAPDPTLYRLKTQPFDEVTKNLLAQLGKVLGPAHQCLTNVPLSDFVRAADGNDFNLKTRQVPYLIVARESLEIVCGLQFKDGAAASVDFLKGVFADIGRPLVEFPVSTDISEAEVREALTEVFSVQDQQDCPRCGESMTIRTAMKGKNAGSAFWVCTQFPGCRGVVRI